MTETHWTSLEKLLPTPKFTSLAEDAGDSEWHPNNFGGTETHSTSLGETLTTPNLSLDKDGECPNNFA